MIYVIKDENGVVIYKSENKNDRDKIYKKMIIEKPKIIKEDKNVYME